jgi:predicted nucleic acid-binding Zn finger protein
MARNLDPVLTLDLVDWDSGNAITYTLIRLGPGSWRLRHCISHNEYVVDDLHCTCPDHQYRGRICKHMRALDDLGLLEVTRINPSPNGGTP